MLSGVAKSLFLDLWTMYWIEIFFEGAMITKLAEYTRTQRVLHGQYCLMCTNHHD